MGVVQLMLASQPGYLTILEDDGPIKTNVNELPVDTTETVDVP